MKKENLAFLVAGFAFGLLFGFGLFNALEGAPEVLPGGTPAGPAATGSPAGPRAPGQVGPSQAAGGAPMMAEINALKTRLQSNPNDAQVLTRLANIYHDAAMWDEAISYYERVLENGTPSADVLTDMGVCFRNKKQYDRALELFDRAQTQQPGHWQSLYNTAIVSGFDLGQFERALEAVAAMEAMNLQNPRIGELRDALEQASQTAGAGG